MPKNTASPHKKESQHLFMQHFHAAWGEDRGNEERHKDYDKNAWMYVQSQMEKYFEKISKES